ncbi:TetR/AcrR family transcriptional regulator [Nocardioides sp.]|uniref:TetR/AcrR family transcriptional regulator n=1 Tax=Nocardioides sp. TaxID=35761 RepID=UPI002EDA7E64
MSTSQGATGEPRRSRGRPRTPGAEQRIIDAALEEYGEHGWSGFTMDGVARRAGVGKSTVYLRWQDKDTLLTDAVGTHTGDLGDVDTGSLRGDLHALAVKLFHHYREPAGWAALRVVVDTAGAPEPLGGFTQAVTDVLADYAVQMGARAVERGELDGDRLVFPIGQCIFGSVIVQNLTLRLEGRALSDEEIDERASILVDLILDGART